MFKLAIEVWFENYFKSIYTMFLSLGSTKSVVMGNTVHNIQTRRKNSKICICLSVSRMETLTFLLNCLSRNRVVPIVDILHFAELLVKIFIRGVNMKSTIVKNTKKISFIFIGEKTRKISA